MPTTQGLLQYRLIERPLTVSISTITVPAPDYFISTTSSIREWQVNGQ